MLAAALKATLGQSGDFARVVKKKTLDAYAKGQLLAGRQISHLLCQHLKINDDLSLVYSINDLAALRWQGDAPDKMARFKSDWERVVDNIGPSVRIADEALRDMLYEQMKHSADLRAEIAHFKCTPADHNYDFLSREMQRHIDDHRVEQNRKSQTQSYKGPQDPNALANNPKPKGGAKQPSSATPTEGLGTQGNKSPHPCFFYQTDECKMTADKCRYQHVKLSKADFEALKQNVRRQGQTNPRRLVPTRPQSPVEHLRRDRRDRQRQGYVTPGKTLVLARVRAHVSMSTRLRERE